jgi:50S ribosomal subunit-associated GTPase HflX
MPARPLFNVLTRSDSGVNALFVTLDPLVRKFVCRTAASTRLGHRRFIDRLPHALVAAFRATLEDVADADLVLHIIDASATDRDRRVTAVHRVLEEVGASDVPTLDVYNKCDAVTPDERRRLQELDPAALCISALTSDGVDELIETIASRVALDVQRVTLTFNSEDPADRERIARVYRHGRVLEHETRTAGCRSSPTFRAALSNALKARRGKICIMRRIALVVLLTTIAACAPKTIPPAAVSSAAPKYPDFLAPTVPAALAEGPSAASQSAAGCCCRPET